MRQNQAFSMMVSLYTRSLILSESLTFIEKILGNQSRIKLQPAQIE